MVKRDRRITRTRALLRSALMELILETGYESITIQDITDRANLGRATFYMHYKDKEDLLLTSMREGYQALVEQIDNVHSTFDDPFPLRVVFDYAAANRDLFLVILYGAGKTIAYQQARDFIADRARMLIQDIISPSRVPLEVASIYYAGALVSILVWWLEQGMPYTSQKMEEMVLLMFRTGMKGLRSDA